MASRPVPTQYLTAGQEYLDALRSLGLTPNYLGWGWDIAAEQWLLVLVTPIVDAGGPLALNKLSIPRLQCQSYTARDFSIYRQGFQPRYHST
jgi:hypothetical protein